MKYSKGFKFLSHFREFEVIEFLDHFKMYLINNITDNRQDELMYEKDIDECLTRQEEFKVKFEKNN
jgi:hypothetical protein